MVVVFPTVPLVKIFRNHHWILGSVVLENIAWRHNVYGKYNVRNIFYGKTGAKGAHISVHYITCQFSKEVLIKNCS